MMRLKQMSTIYVVLIAGSLLVSPLSASEPPSKDAHTLKWYSFPDPRFEVCGMAWFTENTPQLHRLPQRSKDKVGPRIWNLAQVPSGGRICFTSNTSQLKIQLSGSYIPVMDVYVDGVYWSSGQRTKGKQELTFFQEVSRTKKEVAIYLPLRHEIGLLAIGMDEDAKIALDSPFARKRPIVFYGSSVLQGLGTRRPGMSYPAILCRQLNMDYINLGFSGSGKAEPEVVSLVNEIDACCFIFDLGKSYGRQSAEAYIAMLEKIRSSHPKTPMICITPIFSTKELYDKDYVQLSRHIRKVVQEAVKARIKSGDRNIFLVKGESDLLSRNDSDAYSSDGVHPTDLGFQRIADRLKPQLEKILLSLDKK